MEDKKSSPSGGLTKKLEAVFLSKKTFYSCEERCYYIGTEYMNVQYIRTVR